jgi:isopenicillin N synthase-like dioxygenase
MGMIRHSAELAVIDLAALDDDAAAAIDDACRTLGFYIVIGHGIPEAVRARAFNAAHRFFALPDADKQAIHISKSYPNQRGYAPFFEETIDDTGPREFKEAFDMGRPLAADDPDLLAQRPFHALNVWPDGIDGFREAMEDYHAHALALGQRLVRLTARGLGLDDGYFDPSMDKAVANLRLLRYPPESQADDGPGVLTGVGPHTDYGFLTILAHDGVPGLELMTAAGAWMSVPQVAGGLIVNTGELLQRWTNDRYRATVHRVSNRTDRDRYSIPFFLDTNIDADVRPVPTCVDARNRSRYAPVLGGDYLKGRFDQTFAYRADLSDAGA